MNQSISNAQLIQNFEYLDTKKVKIAITDIDGILRGKYIHIDKFKSALNHGLGFCNVVFGWDSSDQCYDNIKYTGWHSGYPDATARLDTKSYRQVPWDHNIPFFLADFYTNDQSGLDICPRQILKNQVKKAQSLGYEISVGCEFEWFNFNESPNSLKEKHFTNPKPLTPGMFGYSLLRSSLNQTFFNDLMDQLELFKVPLEGLHTETGPGVIEAAIKVAPALEAADRAVLFKTATKEIAYRHNIMASFMARWNTQLPGCSGHIHQSLTKDGKNLFYSSSDQHGMSQLFKNYLAGLIKYCPELLPMMAPTINSYKRLVKGFWAPTSSTWGIDNRTCAFRVIPGQEKSTRVEVRIPGADINPYLAVAACISGGLRGIEENLPLEQDAIVGNGYEDTLATNFPTNLKEASDLMRGSSMALDSFGQNFVNHYCNSREWEWNQYQQSVSRWELERYFEII